MVKKTIPSPSFEETLSALTAVVNHLESGELSLDAALNEFETGVKLVRQGQQQLQQAQQRVQILLNESAEGELAEFDLPAPDLAARGDHE